MLECLTDDARLIVLANSAAQDRAGGGRPRHIGIVDTLGFSRDDCDARSNTLFADRGLISENRDGHDGFRSSTDCSKPSRGGPTGDNRCSTDRDIYGHHIP